MADFLATYGIDDKALAIGLKRIEAMAAEHTNRVNAVTDRASTSIAAGAGRTLSKGLLGVVGFGSAAAAVTVGVRFAIREASIATEHYAKVNDVVARQLREVEYRGEAAYQSLGREVSGVTMRLRELGTEARSGLAEMISNIKVMAGSGLSGLSPSIFRAGERAKAAQDLATLVERSRLLRSELEAARLQNDPGMGQRLGVAEIQAEAFIKKQLLDTEKLRFQLTERGQNVEAARLERSIRLTGEQIVLDEKRRQLDEQLAGRNKVRAELESLNQKYVSARQGAAEVLEANAMRLFGLEASQRQLQVAEAQLRYDKQLRDLAADKALLEEDRARASALILEQRDAELGLLRAFRGGAGPGRGIALGSSVNPLQVFAKGKDEEKADRREAQKKFDKMIGELRSIRENTAKAQRATYQEARRARRTTTHPKATMPIEAKEFRDTVNGKAGYLKRSRAGFEGLRYFEVNSDLEHVALFAPGLPKIGDPYSLEEELRLCVVTDVGPTERVGGTDRGDGTGGGLTYVPVRYQSLSSVGGGGNEPPRPQAHLDRWCLVRTSLETQPITLPVDEDDVPDEQAAQIHNGEGTTRPAVVTDYLVSVAYDERRGAPDLDRYDALGDPCHTNRGNVSFPPVLRTTLQRQKGPGECLYKGYELAQDGDLLVVTHTIAVRSRGELSWKYVWERKNESGDVLAIMESRVVPSADWTGLFE